MSGGMQASLAPVLLVAGIPLRDSKLLLGRRAANRKSFPGCWDLIGGHVEAGETAEQAFLREMDEEIGILPVKFTHWGDWDMQLPSALLRMTIFRIEEWRGDPHLANDEHDQLAWFDLDAAAALPNLASDRYPALFQTLLA